METQIAWLGMKIIFNFLSYFRYVYNISGGLILRWIWAIRWKTWRIQQIDPNSGHISTLISGPVTRRHTWPGTWQCGDAWLVCSGHVMTWRPCPAQEITRVHVRSHQNICRPRSKLGSVTMCRRRLQVTRPVNLSWHFNQIYTKLLLVHWSELTAEIEIFCVAAKLEQSPG